MRYQSAREMRADLKRLRRDTESGKATAISGFHGSTQAPASNSFRRRLVHATAALVLVALAVAALYIRNPPPPPKIVGTTQLTSDGTLAWLPMAAGCI